MLGNGAYALHEVEDLLPVASRVTVLTNGLRSEAEFPGKVAVIEKKIRRLLGKEKLCGVELEDGETLQLDGFFVALGSAGGVALARKLGLPIQENKITVDAAMATMIPGLFAAGDCVSDIQQASVAVGQGAIAGLSAIKFLRA